MHNNTPNNNGEAGPKISENQCQSVAKSGRGWGGKRPGAGAPKDNLNALKHGRRSRQFAEIGAVLAEHPDIRHSLLAAARRRTKQNARAEEIAADLIIRLFQHAGDVAAGRDSPGPFREMIRLSERPRRLSAAQSSHRRAILTETLAQIAAATQSPDDFQPNNQPSRPQSSEPPNPGTNPPQGPDD